MTAHLLQHSRVLAGTGSRVRHRPPRRAGGPAGQDCATAGWGGHAGQRCWHCLLPPWATWQGSAVTSRPSPSRLMAPRAAQVRCRQRRPSRPGPAGQPSGRSARWRCVTSLRRGAKQAGSGAGRVRQVGRHPRHCGGDAEPGNGTGGHGRSVPAAHAAHAAPRPHGASSPMLAGSAAGEGPPPAGLRPLRSHCPLQQTAAVASVLTRW